MAKKSLKERIDALVNALGAAEKPSSVQIRNELVSLALDMEKLEDGQALAQKDARISDLEAALEKSDVQLCNLKVLLEEAGEEVQAFRAEQKEREKKDADLPDEQVELLRILQPESLGMMQLSEILESISIREDEAVWHLGQLRKLKLADFSHHSIGYEMWYRTELGNAHVIARRLADRGDLPDIAEKILAELSPPGRAPGRADLTAAEIAFLLSITEDLALSYLERLRGAGFAIRAYTSKGALWSRHPDGTEYLKAKRLTSEDEEKPSRKHADRTELEQSIMEALAMLGPMDCHGFATNTRISADRAEVALYDLEKDRFVKIVKPAETGEEPEYDLSIEGVRYLLEREFLN